MMESLGEILGKKTPPINTPRANTDTSSSVDEQGETISSPDCPLCKGAGFVYPLSASGHPDFRRVVPCQCYRGELQKDKLAVLEHYSNLGPLSRLTFDNLRSAGRHGNDTNLFATAFETARAFATNPQGWLVFIGPTGCGKTHLTCAIVNHQLSLAQPAFYIRVADLLDHLRSTFSPDSDTAYDELFEQVKNTPLLALDDLISVATTPWARSKLEQLLDYRFDAQLPTIIATDMSIEHFEGSIHSHITDTEFCQICTIQDKSMPALEHLNILASESLQKMSFKRFDCKRLSLPPDQRHNLETALNLASSFAQSPKDWLVFLGVNGCGKTHLAAAIANSQLKTGKPVIFLVVPDFLDYLRSTFSPESKVSYDELFEKVKRSPVLILDDFGEQSATPWAQEKLYQLINYRYNARLATVITSCLSLDQIEPRISSRIGDPSLSIVWNITAPDYRIDRPQQRRRDHRP